jgi:hypothetical protein
MSAVARCNIRLYGTAHWSIAILSVVLPDIFIGFVEELLVGVKFVLEQSLA